MTLPQDCCVTGIEDIYSQLQTMTSNQTINLDAQNVVHLDLSFYQCLKALEQQQIKVVLNNPTEAVKTFCRLYQATHFIEGS